MRSDPEQVRRSRASVVRVVKEDLAPWLKGEVRRHCARCEATVGREDRACRSCGAPLRKECPRCRYWVELDTTFCVSCRYGFPLPAPEKAMVRLWHGGATEGDEAPMLEENVIGSAPPGPSTKDGGP